MPCFEYINYIGVYDMTKAESIIAIITLASLQALKAEINGNVSIEQHVTERLNLQLKQWIELTTLIDDAGPLHSTDARNLNAWASDVERLLGSF